MYTAVQKQKEVSAYFAWKQILFLPLQSGIAGGICGD